MRGAQVLIALGVFFVTLVQAEEPMKPYSVLDLHSDIMLRAIDNGVDIGDPPDWAQATLPNLEKGHVGDQVFAIWVSSKGERDLEETLRAIRMIDLFEQQMAKYPDRVELATTVSEAERIRESGRVAAWLWLEGGGPVAEDLALLRTFHRMGVRGMTLTWNYNLSWAGSGTDKNDPNMALTDFGREVVREMNRLGMIVDVSHVSEATFFDAIETSADPIVASHSCCRALCDHPRNLTDKQLRALAENGGVVGICILPEYLKDNWGKGWEETDERLSGEIAALKERYSSEEEYGLYREARRQLIQKNLPAEVIVTLDDYLDHIDHAIKVAGWEHVAVGSDFDGTWAFPSDFERPSQWQEVARRLRERGHSEQTVRGVMGDNARRVFRQVIDR